MKIYNLTGSNLTFTIGAARVQVKNLESSSSIVATPELVRNNIMPLIEAFNGGLLLVPNTSDMLVFDMPGCKVPADCVVDDETANRKLAKAISEFKRKNSNKEPKLINPEKPETKVEEPKVTNPSDKPDDKAKEEKEDDMVNPSRTEEKPTMDGIKITKVPGKESQEIKN